MERSSKERKKPLSAATDGPHDVFALPRRIRPSELIVGAARIPRIDFLFPTNSQAVPAPSAPSRFTSTPFPLTHRPGLPTIEDMEVQLTRGQKAFANEAIKSGRLGREEDAVQEALALWEERERTRAEILAAVDEAEASLKQDGGRIITQESMRELAEDVKRRGRLRLAAEQSLR